LHTAWYDSSHIRLSPHSFPAVLGYTDREPAPAEHCCRFGTE
jgi:hypothetical protein